MKRIIVLMVFLYLFGNVQGKPIETKSQDGRSLEDISERIARTTPEGLTILNKILTMKPEVNERHSVKRLGEIIEDFSSMKGDLKINSIGWEVVKKGTSNWKIVLYYQEYKKGYQAAEWEYNPKTNQLYPFEFNHAPLFFIPRKKSKR